MKVNEQAALSGIWRVEDIDQGGVIDNSLVTMQFDDEDLVSGSTGCNAYSAALDTRNHTFVVSRASTTRRACVPAINQQEQRFLSALYEITHYAIEAETWMVLYDHSDTERLRMTRMNVSAE